VRFVIYGAGAVGGVVGGRLAQYGHDVLLIARGPHLEVTRLRGLLVRSADGDVTLPISVAGDPAEAKIDDGDVVMLCMKSQDTASALAALQVAAPPTTPIVCLQNGVANERTALRLFSDVYAVPVMLPSTHLEPGVVVANSAPVSGILDVGRYPSGVDERAEAISVALRASTFSSEARPDVMRFKWSKLLMNVGNAVQALFEGQPEAADVLHQARREGLACFQSAGIDVATKDEDEARRGDLLTQRPVDGASRGGGSTWQSLARQAGSVEADYLNGEIVLLGRLHGVPTPVNALLQRWANDAARERAQPGAADVGAFKRELADIV
jgi:2-dehydropantoate 2-reductase